MLNFYKLNKKMKILNQITIAIFSVVLLSSCGSDAPKQEVETKVEILAEKVWEEIEVSALGNTMMEMKYSVENITVQEGA
jgi:PBP1b-binding outer membrane lipoprotein LpoB